MAKTQVVKNAKFRPGKCALSNDTQGPFLDTGREIPRYGRVYLSFKWLDEHLRTAGYLSQQQVAELQELVDEVSDKNRKLEEKAQYLDELVNAVLPYIPETDPEVVEKEVVRHRAPTDDEIAEWIEKSGGNHPVVRRAKAPEPGSAEEWDALYGHRRDVKPEKKVQYRQQDETEVTDEPGGDPDETHDEGPSRYYELHDQQIDLDEVLKQNVSDIAQFAEDKDEDFKDALVRREYFLARQGARHVRKGVLAPLGYWDEEDDEALIPDDEEE